MNEKFVRYVCLIIVLVIIVIGYKTNHFYFVWIALIVAALSRLLADNLKLK